MDGNFKGSQQNSRSNGARRFVGHRCSLTQVQAVSIAQQNGFAALGFAGNMFFHVFSASTSQFCFPEIL